MNDLLQGISTARERLKCPGGELAPQRKGGNREAARDCSRKERAWKRNMLHSAMTAHLAIIRVAFLFTERDSFSVTVLAVTEKCSGRDSDRFIWTASRIRCATALSVGTTGRGALV